MRQPWKLIVHQDAESVMEEGVFFFFNDEGRFP